jgi:IclR helix-turn-helix domain
MATDEHPPISITLSPAQVDQVLRAAARSRAPSVSALVSGALRAPTGAGSNGAPADVPSAGPAPAGFMPRSSSDRRLSQSLLRGLSILTCFGADGGERGILELSRELELSASTTHRYAQTLVELGLLERSSRTRRYRLPAPSPPPG